MVLLPPGPVKYFDRFGILRSKDGQAYLIRLERPPAFKQFRTIGFNLNRVFVTLFTEGFLGLWVG